MHGIKSLIVVALAATASATYFNGELLRREVLLHARKPSSPTNSSSAAVPASSASGVPTGATNGTNSCSSALQGLATLITGLPKPTGALSSYLATAATTLTDPCHLTVPSSLASTFSVYESSVISFYSAHISQLDSALAACPSLTSLVANPVCSTAATGGATATATATTTPTSTAPASPMGTSSVPASSSGGQVVSTAGANINPRETGMVAAAMVAAGLLGAMAVAL